MSLKSIATVLILSQTVSGLLWVVVFTSTLQMRDKALKIIAVPDRR